MISYYLSLFFFFFFKRKRFKFEIFYGKNLLIKMIVELSRSGFYLTFEVSLSFREREREREREDDRSRYWWWLPTERDPSGQEKRVVEKGIISCGQTEGAGVQVSFLRRGA
jgi:hypothetical protein